MAEHAERTSDRLLRIAATGETPRLAIKDLLVGLGDRAFGVILLVLALPISIPTIPGLSVVCGTPMLVFSLQMILGRHRPWLPGFLESRNFARDDFRAVVEKALPYVRRFEHLCRPRLEALTRGVFQRLAGMVVLVMALIIVLPTPPIVGNIPSAVAVAVIAIGFIERDGVAVLLGHALAVVATTVTFGVIAALFYAALKLLAAWFA